MSEVLQTLWRSAGGDAAALARVDLSGEAPVLPSSFAVDALAQACIAATALAAADLGHERSGPLQRVKVDRRHAAAEFRSERYLRVDGQALADPWDRIAGLYRCAGDGWVRLHTNFPHHRDSVLALLGCAYERDAVAKALRDWQAPAFEQAATEAGGVVAALRSFDVWDAHPQGQAVAAEPLLRLERVGDAPALPLPALQAGERPLAGVRVLDLTRIIAGPVATRALAAHGADVMRITAAHLPTIATLDPDIGRGKRSVQLDLRQPADAATLWSLVDQADVFVQGYRPGALAALGFSAEALVRRRPGLVVASLNAYGTSGPWAGRRGFDSLVQTASGLNLAEMEAAGEAVPRALPAQALDHGTGFVLALGIVQALRRRQQQGGSWQVRASLARTGLWLRHLRRGTGGFGAPDPGFDDIADLLEDSASGFGRLTAVRHAAQMSHAGAFWSRPAARLGHDAPVW